MARKRRSVVTAAPVSQEAERAKVAKYRDTFQHDLGEKVEDFGSQIAAHKRTLLYALAGLAALAIAFGVFYSWNRRTNSAGQAALSKAIETSDAAVTNNPPPLGSATKQFKTAKERAQAAIPELQAVADQYGGSIGETARYYIALNQLTLDRPTGVSQLEQLANGSSPVSKMSKFALAQARVDDGQADAAVALYKELADMSDPIVPKDTVNIELAKLYEKQGNKQAASDLLFNIVNTANQAKDLEGKPVPLNAAAQEAKQKLTEIDPERAKQIVEPALPEVPAIP